MADLSDRDPAPDAVDLLADDRSEPQAGTASRRPLAIGAVVLLLAVAAVVVVTRGNDERGVSADDPAGLASAATYQERTARVRLRSGDGTNSALEGTLAFGLDGRAAFADPDQGLRIVILPDAGYFQVRDDQWIRLSNEEMSVNLGVAAVPGQSPFLVLVDVLVGALDHADPDSVAVVGTDTSHGDPVTVHTAIVDVGAVLRARLDVVDEDVFERFVADFGEQATIWVDTEGRARFVGFAGGEERIEVDLWDFGVEVVAEAPEQSVDLSEAGG